MAEEKKQRRLLKKKRAGIVLTEDQVKEIKAERKKLRKEMKANGIKSKQEFEMVAGSLGFYFDKRSSFLLWFFHGRGLWALLGALLALMFAFFLMSLVSQMRGYFTINLSSGLFREGFTLSETVDFANPVVNLYCEPATDVPCISIIQIDEDVDFHDGAHNGAFFAYTFYCRNEGEVTSTYTWDLELNDESKNLSEAAWVMMFEDGEMTFYAKKNATTGQAEALPAFDDDSRGYMQTPFVDVAADPDEQYQLIREKNGISYYRLVPRSFQSGNSVATGIQEGVAPMEVHKYTVVIWLEGDDPDCDNSLIGGHLGLDMQFRLVDETEEDGSGENKSWWDSIWSNLKNR